MISGGLTVLDTLAVGLVNAVRLAGEIGETVLGWIRTAMRWLGREVRTTAADITRALLRYILQTFFGQLAGLALRSIDVMRRRVI